MTLLYKPSDTTFVTVNVDDNVCMLPLKSILIINKDKSFIYMRKEVFETNLITANALRYLLIRLGYYEMDINISSICQKQQLTKLVLTPSREEITIPLSHYIVHGNLKKDVFLTERGRKLLKKKLMNINNIHLKNARVIDVRGGDENTPLCLYVKLNGSSAKDVENIIAEELFSGYGANGFKLDDQKKRVYVRSSLQYIPESTSFF